ncbi:MAG: hypothetical protein U0S48_06975 [Solirubrobacteraceae bacterium]
MPFLREERVDRRGGASVPAASGELVGEQEDLIVEIAFELASASDVGEGR